MQKLKSLITFIVILVTLLGSPQMVRAAIHPHVLYNPLEIADLKSRILAKEEPLTSHYQALKNYSANSGTGNNFYSGNDPKILREKLDIDGPVLFSHAMGYALDNNQDDAKKARDLLVAWSASLSQVNSYDDFSQESNNKEAAAMFLGRAMFQIVPAYDLIYTSQSLSDQDRTSINGWLRKVSNLIIEGMDSWFNSGSPMPCHNYSNHVSAHLTGLILIGYILEDDGLVSSAVSGDSLPTNWQKFLQQNIYMGGDPVIGCDSVQNSPTNTGEIVDRYRHLDHPGSDPALKLNRGLGYSLLSTYNLALGAEAAYHHGLDLYNFTAPTSENLILPGIYYSHYLKTFGVDDAIITTTNYSGEVMYVGEIMQKDFIKPYELLTYRYHNNLKLAYAFSKYYLPSRQNLNLDYIFGKLYRYDQTGWEFLLDDIEEGWTTPTNIIKNGTLQITTRDNNTKLISPELYLRASDYPILHVHMKASGGGNHQGTITWNNSHNLSFGVLADGQFHDYIIDLREQSGWTGTITKLELLPIDVASSTVVIDWIRLQNDYPTNIKAGDLNNDNIVNIYDYNQLISGYGTKYDQADFTTLISNFGK